MLVFLFSGLRLGGGSKSARITELLQPADRQGCLPCPTQTPPAGLNGAQLHDDLAARKRCLPKRALQTRLIPKNVYLGPKRPVRDMLLGGKPLFDLRLRRGCNFFSARKISDFKRGMIDQLDPTVVFLCQK